MLGTVRVAVCQALLGYSESVGVYRASLCRAAGLDEQRLADPDGLMSYAELLSLWHQGYELTGDENFALHVGEWAPNGPPSVLTFLFRNAPTVGDAYRKIARLWGSLDNTTKLFIEEHEPIKTITFEKTNRTAAARQELDWLFALLHSGLRAVMGAQLSLAAVEFVGAASSDPREHQRVFGCPVRFGARANRLSFTEEVWEAQNPNANAALAEILERHARGLMAGLPAVNGLRATVHALVSARLEEGALSIESTAKQLGMSARTLQRRLAEEGESFGEVVDHARRLSAERMLTENVLPLAEIALLVGFSEQSAFTRAFKKWTDTTPAHFRRERRK